jgi:hypothetical protein
MEAVQELGDSDVANDIDRDIIPRTELQVPSHRSSRSLSDHDIAMRGDEDSDEPEADPQPGRNHRKKPSKSTQSVCDNFSDG